MTDFTQLRCDLTTVRYTMIDFSDLPEILPFFSLSGALLLPRANLPLQIYEPHYREMIEDCIKTPERLIGIVQPIENKNKTGEVRKIGCAGRLTAFSEMPDGTYMITLTGLCRFHVVEEVSGPKPYLQGRVSWSRFQGDMEAPEGELAQFNRDMLISFLKRYLKIKGLSTNWENLEEADDETLINALAILCPFIADEKQILLETDDLNARSEVLIMLMKFALFDLPQKTEIQ